MPVPKSKQVLHGKIVGANINNGKSLSESKSIADKAVKVKAVPITSKQSKSRNVQARERTRNEVQKVKKLKPNKLF